MNKIRMENKSMNNIKKKGIYYSGKGIRHVNIYNHTFISIDVTGVYLFLKWYDIVHYLTFFHELALIFIYDFRKEILEPVFYDFRHNFVRCITQGDGPKCRKKRKDFILWG